MPKRNKGKRFNGRSHSPAFRSAPQKFGGGLFSKSFNRFVKPTPTISPERRRQLELERQKRMEYEKNFKCDFQKQSGEDADSLMSAKSVFLKRRVSFGMENRGNTCFFNSVMQCLAHTLPLHQYCVADASHD